MSTERTFSRDLHDDDDLERELLRLTVSVAASLRQEGLRARTLTVKLRDSDFTTRQRAHTFPEPVEAEPVLYPAARRLLGELRAQRSTGARLLGVGLSNLEEGDAPRQLALFNDHSAAPADMETDRDRLLARTVDRLRSRFGRDAVLPGRIVDPGDARRPPPHPPPSSDPGS